MQQSPTRRVRASWPAAVHTQHDNLRSARLRLHLPRQLARHELRGLEDLVDDADRGRGPPRRRGVGGQEPA